ncbi:MAG: hypothetical protein ACRD26_05085 [Vicinamibacterales bacterium]
MHARYSRAAGGLLALAAMLVLIEPVVLGGPLDARRGGWLSIVVQQGPFVLAWGAALCAAAALGWLPRMRAPRITRDDLLRWATRGVPVADARAVAVFRIVFAAGLLHVVRVHRIDGYPTLEAATLGAIALFGIGLVTRPAFVAATAGVWAWMFVWTRQFGSHPVSALVIALPCLWPARWSDAWSVDALFRQRPAGPRSTAYGFAIWMPRLVLGVALCAAAVAKMTTPEWIANGTVKFAFVADYHRASVPWGLWIATQPALAVTASAAAIAIELLALTAAFSRTVAYRLVVAALVASLLAGFFLLQGELWRGWWLLLAALLPWERLSRRDALVEAAPRLTRAQWAAAAALVVAQAVASALGLEIRPALSAYDMYSTTFDSTAAFDRANPMLEYRFEAETGDGRWANVTDCFDRPASPDIAAAWGADTLALRRSLSTCDQEVPSSVQRLRLFESLRAFDWQTGRFWWKYRDRERWTVPI